jgi:CrcB protein
LKLEWQSFTKLATFMNTQILKEILTVGFGGLTGSLLRYFSGQWITKNFSGFFPWGTLFVNILGCLFIGIVIQSTQNMNQSSVWRLLLATGFCGGFTTFSAFAQENLKLLHAGHFLLFITYTAFSIAGGILAVLAGILIVRLLQ